MFPEELKGFVFVVSASALLAYALTSMARSALEVMGHLQHKWASLGLRVLATFAGGVAGMSSASVWLHTDKMGGGLLIGLTSGAFCTWIVWALKKTVLSRLGLGSDVQDEIGTVDDDGDGQLQNGGEYGEEP